MGRYTNRYLKGLLAISLRRGSKTSEKSKFKSLAKPPVELMFLCQIKCIYNQIIDSFPYPFFPSKSKPCFKTVNDREYIPLKLCNCGILLFSPPLNTLKIVIAEIVRTEFASSPIQYIIPTAEQLFSSFSFSPSSSVPSPPPLVLD